MSGSRLDQIAPVVQQAIAQGKLPGAVVLVGRKGKIVYWKAFGHRSLAPRREPMTRETEFDLASLTKPVCTAPSVMALVESGRIRLQDPVSRYLPEVGEGSRVTLEQLLVHLSGYASGLDRTRPWSGHQGALQELARERLRFVPGRHFEYSDINYIALGLLVERVSGQTQEAFARQHLFAPLQMNHTHWGEVSEGVSPSEKTRGGEVSEGVSRVAPTQWRGGQMLRGSVHDHVAARMGGVAGHAGLFSRADDLARFCQMMLQGGKLGGKEVLSPATVARMVRPVMVGPQGWTRGLGWDIDTSYSSNRGDLFPRGSFGHTGFTGTSLWLDPVSQTFVVFLSNRVHPDGSGDVVALRGQVATLAAAAIQDLPPSAWKRFEEDYLAALSPQREIWNAQITPESDSLVPGRRVLNGIDLLQEEHFRSLEGLRLGLVTNHTGRNRSGQLTVDLLHQAPNLRLCKIFSPEHGLRGELDEPVGDSRDPATGLPVISLYGERKRPRAEDLEGLDALVFDIQDAGARFYTYSATLRYLLEAAAGHNLTVWVLDRPNPINGLDVEGPVSDPAISVQEATSFTCPHELPVRHGMTMGELALMYNQERHLGARLQVVKMDPWSRNLWFDQTEQTWVAPSPNLRNPQATLLYPGVCLLEACNLSVGRGTDRPFEQIGAPWVDGQGLATLLNARPNLGLRFVAVRFRPSSSRFSGQDCEGVQILVVDRSRLRSLRLGLELISALWRLHPQDFQIDRVDALLHAPSSLQALKEGHSPESVEASWQADLEAFRKRRQPFLLYP